MNRFGILFGPFSIKIQPQNRTYIKYKIHEVAAIFIVRLQDGDNFSFFEYYFSANLDRIRYGLYDICICARTSSPSEDVGSSRYRKLCKIDVVLCLYVVLTCIFVYLFSPAI